MKSIVILGAVATAFAATKLASAQQITLESLPPVVVRTEPVAGTTNVDPATIEIRVTFSKDMMTNRMWAIYQISKETFPERNGPIHYINQRTCVMPVKLEPGKAYALWFNRGRFNNFRDTNNNSAVPYLLAFSTSAARHALKSMPAPEELAHDRTGQLREGERHGSGRAVPSKPPGARTENFSGHVVQKVSRPTGGLLGAR